ncbi:MAG: FtsB family cell division protein [Chitinophagaceae bacterium]
MNRIPTWITNKYFLAAAFLLIWLSFFDRNDLYQTYKRNKELKDLRISQEYFLEQIDKTKVEVNAMKLNAKSLEKVAREKFHMKRENEDLFLIDEK